MTDPDCLEPVCHRRKPIEHDVIRWDGSAESAKAIADWLNANGHQCSYVVALGAARFVIHTLEGPLTASPGDYIVRGVLGEFWACKPEAFTQTYERA